MKGKLQQFSVKLLASTLAVIMSIPANAFAMVGDNSNTYTENTSVMGIQAPEETKEDQAHTALLKSELGTDESNDYIIKKSASLSKTTGQIDYIIKIINKTPEKESSDKQTTTFAITQNTDLLDLKVEKVQALDANGNEEEINYTQGTPNAFNSTDNIRSTGITTNKPQNGVVYYLSAKLTDQALKDLEQKSPQLALDFTIASPDNKIYQDRYALEIEKANTTEITIDNEGNIANPEGRLVENQESLHLYKGEYKEEQKGIFQSTPAQIIWTDYINAKDNKEFTYDINLDQGQDTTESQVKIEYYEAQEKGYVLNESFTKTLAFVNNLKLSIPEGYIAKVELNTRPKENTKEFAYNGIKIPNPTYTEEKNEAKEEQASDDADPLPNIFSKNDAEVNSSNDSITDQKDQDFSTNSTDEKESPTTHTLSKYETGSNSSNNSITDQKDQNFSTNSKTDSVENLSAIALNKDAYFDKLKADDKLTANIEEATNEIEQILEAYNKEEINWDDFKQSVQNIKNDKEIDESQTKDILASLLIGLNEEKYKVANIDIDQAAGSDTEEKTEETADQAKTEEGKDLSDKTPDELAKAKLAEEGVTIEDFQNYMYELEEKYGLTDEDADRVYKENAEAIGALVKKAQEEKNTGDVFAVTSGFANKTFRLTTNMNVLSIPLWSIPAGWYFDINVGPYLYLNSKPNNLVVNGRTVATAQYFPATNTVRYTFKERVYKTTSIPINQDFKFKTEAIGNRNPIDVKISVKPKNNPGQTQSYTVYKDSSKNPSESNNIYESKVVLDKGEFTQNYGTHISRDEGNNIRYSYVPSKSIMNSYELAYRDMANGDPDLSYYVLLEANPGDGSFTNNSTIDIGLTNNKTIMDVGVFKVPSKQLDGLKESFVNGNVKQYLGKLEQKSQTGTLNDGSHRISLSANELNSDAYLIKVRANDAKDGETFQFRYKWQSGNDTIDNWNNVYVIELANKSTGGSTLTPPETDESTKYESFPLEGNGSLNHVKGKDKYGSFDDHVYCIQIERQQGINGPTKREYVTDGSQIASRLSPRNHDPLGKSPYNTNEELMSRLKKAFYYAEAYKDDPDYEEILQAAIYYVVGGSTVDGANYAHEYRYLNGDPGLYIPGKSQNVKNKANELINKVKRNDNWDTSKENSVELYVFESKRDMSQNGIWGKVHEIPTSNFKIKKVANDESKTPLENVGFTLYASDKETVIGSTFFNSKGEYFTNDQGELYYSNLPDGIYYLKETSIPNGYIVKDGDPFTTIIIESGKTKLLAGSVYKEDFDSIINVSKANTSVKITDDAGFDNKVTTDIYGNIDFTKYDDGTYIVSAPGKTTKVTVKDNKVVSFEQDTTNESDNTKNEEPERAWVSDSNYVAHGGYPDYMNVMDYSVVEDPNTKQVTTYLMLKPDSDGQKNGTNKDTYLKFVADNSKISEIEFFRAGSVEIKETLRAAMENRNLENYFGTEYIGDTFENYASSPIKMSNHRYGENSYYNPLNTNYVKPNVNNYYISIPKSRFDYDESYIVKVVTNVTDTNKESSLSYQWASENPYEASLRTQTRNIPALSQMTKNTSIGVLDRVINTLLPTAYAADNQSDYKDVKITKEAINNTTNYIQYDIENIKDETDVSFTKYGLKVVYGLEKSDFLQGAEFTLEKFENGKWTDTRKTAVSDNNGQVKFDKLSTGEYQIIETKTASDKYRMPEGAVKSFKVENGKVFVKTSDDYEAYEDNKNDYIYNELKGEGKLVIKKFDENGNGLNGVEFTLYQFKPASSNSTLDVINTGTTDTINGVKGLVEWDNLKYGKYWLKETRSKDGYIIDSEKKLVTITKNFDVPKPTNPKDVSSKISIKQGEAYMYSTEGNQTSVYPNIAEGLVANLGLAVKSGDEINPGDYFDVKLSENLDLDGVANVLDGSDGKFDIVSQYGTIAKASIGKDRRTIRYTFTNALANRNIKDMKLIVPMYPNRVMVSKDSRPTFKVTVGQSTFTKSNMNVYYSHYQKDGTKPYLNAYTYKLDPYENKFTVIAYVNTNKVYSDMKQYLFEPNVPVEITSFQTYRSENNSSLPPSYGIDFKNYRNYGLTYLGDKYNGVNNRFWVDLENDNKNTYVIKIEGEISGTAPRAFETNSYLTHRNAYNGAWTTYVANTWSRFYDPQACGDSTPANPEPDQAYLEFVNNKNRIEFTKSFVDSNGAELDGDYKIEVINSNGQLPKDADEKTAYFKLTGKNASNKEIKIPNAIVDGKNIAWEKLSPGEYTLEELAPIGFETPAEIKFTVNEGGTITQPTNTELLDNGCYKIANKKPSESKFKILKVDEKGKALSGVVFELTGPENSDENPIEKTSDKDGVIEYNELKPGTYTLKEKNTLNGYVKINQEWTVTVSNGVTSIKPVNNDSYTADSSLDDINQLKSKGYLIIDENSKTEDPSVATIKVLNRKATYPSTGGAGTFIGFALIGTAIMLAGIAYFAIFQNDKNRRRSDRYGR